MHLLLFVFFYYLLFYYYYIVTIVVLNYYDILNGCDVIVCIFMGGCGDIDASVFGYPKYDSFSSNCVFDWACYLIKTKQDNSLQIHFKLALLKQHTIKNERHNDYLISISDKTQL